MPDSISIERLDRELAMPSPQSAPDTGTLEDHGDAAQRIRLRRLHPLPGFRKCRRDDGGQRDTGRVELRLLFAGHVPQHEEQLGAAQVVGQLGRWSANSTDANLMTRSLTR
eukprot:Selendium_serpulae@DN6108_c3_g1_i2.p1